VIQLTGWLLWLVVGSVLLFVPVIALEGAHWWTILPIVLGVLAFVDLIYLRRRFANPSD
jgi:hypothetical protein